MKPPGAAPGSQISATKVQAGVHVRLHALATPIKNLKGVGPKRAAQLRIVRPQNNRGSAPSPAVPLRRSPGNKKIAQAVAGEEASFVGCLVALQKDMCRGCGAR